MKFPESYFEDEIRCGFYVNGMAKSCWAAQLEVLGEIDRICQKHNIQYFAEWGTLLGAIRHGGFIPWDDDMDISMKRADYEKFLKVAPMELTQGCSVVNFESDADYGDVMARVVNSRVVNWSAEFLDRYHNNPYASGVDIFPLDYVSNNAEEEEIQSELIRLVKDVADIPDLDAMEANEKEQLLIMLEEACMQKIDRHANLRQELYRILCRLYALYNEDEADHIAFMEQYLTDGGNIYPKECYTDSIRMPFDVTTIPVPVGYDYLLKHKYGDYMKNVRVGGSHDYPYYEKQNRELIEQGVGFATYRYAAEQKNSKKCPTFRDALLEKLTLLGQVHEKVEMLINYQQYEVVFELLQKLQEIAINIGNSMEEKVGGETEAESLLEQYCEVVFEIYEAVSEGNVQDGNGIRAILDEVLQLVVQSVNTIHFKKEIVFMPYRANQWNAIESVWKAACEDPDCDVKVVPIPYYYKKRLGRAVSELQYDGEQFPEYVPIISYEEYSAENNHPDQIYIQNPYDEWNHAVILPKQYFSVELWKHTEELVYIPWFKLDEMRTDDERGLKSRKYFVSMPGVVNADKVIVQSEEMKQSYVDYLCEWAGEDTRSLWESKIFGTGSPLDDVKEAKPERPEEWADKKLLLYHISGNSLLEHKENMLDKIERTMRIFEEQSERIQILWLQDVQMKQRLECRIPEVFGKYEQILRRCQSKTWVQILDAEEEETAVQLADGFYGDAGKSAQLMKQASKPVMLQNVEI